jgi:hypothetical protein
MFRLFFLLCLRPSLCSSCGGYQLLLSDIPSHKGIIKPNLASLPPDLPKDLNSIDDPLDPAEEPPTLNPDEPPTPIRPPTP